jgi:hypothetical protein
VWRFVDSHAVVVALVLGGVIGTVHAILQSQNGNHGVTNVTQRQDSVELTKSSGDPVAPVVPPPPPRSEPSRGISDSDLQRAILDSSDEKEPENPPHVEQQSMPPSFSFPGHTLYLRRDLGCRVGGSASDFPFKACRWTWSDGTISCDSDSQTNTFVGCYNSNFSGSKPYWTCAQTPPGIMTENCLYEQRHAPPQVQQSCPPGYPYYLDGYCYKNWTSFRIAGRSQEGRNQIRNWTDTHPTNGIQDNRGAAWGQAKQIHGSGKWPK